MQIWLRAGHRMTFFFGEPPLPRDPPARFARPFSCLLLPSSPPAIRPSKVHSSQAPNEASQGGLGGSPEKKVTSGPSHVLGGQKPHIP